MTRIYIKVNTSYTQVIESNGTKSTEMFVLLTGTLSVTALEGTVLTSLSPITIVGEMGLITGQPRSATVVAESQISVFEISKIKFEILMKKYPEIGFKTYRNIIHILSERLDNNNTLVLAEMWNTVGINSPAINPGEHTFLFGFRPYINLYMKMPYINIFYI